MPTYLREASESKKLNGLHVPCVIISPSGMCEAGRVLHHLRNNLGDPRCTILITGYQAENTLGRKLVDNWPEVKVFGEPMRVRAEVDSLQSLSAHADHLELLAWIRSQPSLADLPLMAMSGSENPALQRQALELGATDCALKTPGFEDVVKMVKLLLGG